LWLLYLLIRNLRLLPLRDTLSWNLHANLLLRHITILLRLHWHTILSLTHNRIGLLIIRVVYRLLVASHWLLSLNHRWTLRCRLWLTHRLVHRWLHQANRPAHWLTPTSNGSQYLRLYILLIYTILHRIEHLWRRTLIHHHWLSYRDWMLSTWLRLPTWDRVANKLKFDTIMNIRLILGAILTLYFLLLCLYKLSLSILNVFPFVLDHQ
jgi:hypothetical protein